MNISSEDKQILNPLIPQLNDIRDKVKKLKNQTQDAYCVLSEDINPISLQDYLIQLRVLETLLASSIETIVNITDDKKYES